MCGISVSFLRQFPSPERSGTSPTQKASLLSWECGVHQGIWLPMGKFKIRFLFIAVLFSETQSAFWGQDKDPFPESWHRLLSLSLFSIPPFIPWPCATPVSSLCQITWVEHMPLWGPQNLFSGGPHWELPEIFLCHYHIWHSFIAPPDDGLPTLVGIFQRLIIML